MTARFDPRDFNAALGQLKHAHPMPTAKAMPNGSPAAAEQAQSEELKIKLIAARVKLKLMRDRTDALKEALARFRTQRDSMRA
jgi:hypothetical protein